MPKPPALIGGSPTKMGATRRTVRMALASLLTVGTASAWRLPWRIGGVVARTMVKPSPWSGATSVLGPDLIVPAPVTTHPSRCMPLRKLQKDIVREQRVLTTCRCEEEVGDS